ncbi:RICIN domain-containing protein, partial [Streptomyces sp. NPDC059981]|uniref:RICIN domain-containing protein n=1 Tax=Streptomyces sp. NPDC059981 TaxID=3347023 RepID=UPI00369B6B5B
MLQLEGASRVRVGPDGPPAPAAARRWRISPVHSGGGIFHVVSEDNGRRLDVANASTDSGARVQVWRANAFGAQEWGGGGARPQAGGGGGGAGGKPPPPGGPPPGPAPPPRG